jgi:hypothetical protein
MEALSNVDNKTLKARWAEWDAAGVKTGKGYDLSPDLAQKPVDFLGALPVFKAPTEPLLFAFTTTNTYAELYGKNSRGQSSAHMPRRKELYQPPLVIIPQAPGDAPRAPKAYLSMQAVAFSQSYYGYSCAGHPEAQTLASLIFLLAHSTLFRYFVLMVSKSQGADRMMFAKQDFDSLPFPDIAKLPTKTKTTIRSLAQGLQYDASKPWGEINEFVFQLYGLDADAVQVAEDTLFSAASYRQAGKAALDRTTRATRAHFVHTLREALEPYFDVCGTHAAVREAEFQVDTWREPWFFLAVSREADAVSINPSLMRKAMDVANQRGCSRIMVHAPH